MADTLNDLVDRGTTGPPQTNDLVDRHPQYPQGVSFLQRLAQNMDPGSGMFYGNQTPQPTVPTPPQQPPTEQKPFLQQIPTQIPDISQKLKPLPKPPGPDPQQPIQRYTPAGMRNHTEWGKLRQHDLAAQRHPDYMASTPFFPDDQEAINIIRGGGRQYATYMAPSIGGPMGIASSIASIIGPFFDYFSNNAFSTAYREKMLGGMQMEEHQMRMREQQMMIDRERMFNIANDAMAKHKVMLDDYAEVYDDLRNHRITPEQAKAAILQLNANYNHHVLDGILHDQGLGAVQNQLNWEDAKFQDTMSAIISNNNTAAKKAGKEPGETVGDATIDGTTPSAAGGVGGRVAGGPTGAMGAPYTEDGKAVGSAPTTPDEEPQTQEEMDAEIAKEEGMATPNGMTKAHELARYGTIDGATKTELPKLYPNNAPRLLSAADNIDRRIGNVLNNKSLTKEQKDAALNVIDKGMADEIRDISSYKKHSTEIPAGGIRDKFEGWASAYSGGKYAERKYAKVAEFDDFGKPFNANLRLAAATSQNAINVLKFVNQMPENESIPVRVLQHLGDGTLRGDPKWGALDEAMQNYIQNTSAAMTGTAPRVTLVKSMMERATSNMSPAQLRLILQTDADDVWQKVQPAIKAWKEDFDQEGLPSAIQPSTIAGISALTRMNAYTGQMPTDVPWQYAEIGKDPSTVKNYPSYVKDKSAPWTQDQFREYEARIKKLQADTSAEGQAMLKAYLAHRPPSIPIENPPWQYYDADHL